jgi:hypothetical protein
MIQPFSYFNKILQLLPYVIILVLSILLFFKGCGSKDPEVIKVKVPEVSGEFEPVPPEYVPTPEVPYVIEWKERRIEIPNPVNDSLLKAYRDAQAENDSLKQMLLFLDAIQLREFSNTFEDEYLKLTVSGQVQGKLNYIKPTYTIKSRTLEIEEPQTNLRLLAGFEIGANDKLSEFPLKLNLGMQNAKGNILKASWMRLNGENFYLGGYDFSILNLKK